MLGAMASSRSSTTSTSKETFVIAAAFFSVELALGVHRHVVLVTMIMMSTSHGRSTSEGRGTVVIAAGGAAGLSVKLALSVHCHVVFITVGSRALSGHGGGGGGKKCDSCKLHFCFGVIFICYQVENFAPLNSIMLTVNTVICFAV